MYIIGKAYFNFESNTKRRKVTEDLVRLGNNQELEIQAVEIFKTPQYGSDAFAKFKTENERRIEELVRCMKQTEGISGDSVRVEYSDKRNISRQYEQPLVVS
jgi:hypothetical protein